MEAQPVNFRVITAAEVEEFARIALTDASAERRGAAAAALRPLCHFDQWDRLCELFRATNDVHAHFMLGKAATFIVQNEVGPSERNEIQDFILRFIVERPDLPLFLVRSLLVVFATALYMNWRTMILTMEEQELSDTIGQRIEQQLRSALPERLLLLAVAEVIQHFGREHKRTALRSVQETFATRCLPRFLTIVAQLLPSQGRESVAVATLCLDYPSPASSRPLVPTLAADDVVTLSPMEQWMPCLSQLFAHCDNHVRAALGDSSATDATFDYDAISEEVKFLLHMSQVVFSGYDLAACATAVSSLLNTAVALLMAVPTLPSHHDVFSGGLELFNNVLERHPNDATSVLLAPTNMAINVLKLLTLHTAAHWAQYEDTIRGAMLQAVALVLQNVRSPHPQDPDFAMRQHAYTAMCEAFSTFFNAVITHCHLEENSEDVHSAEALAVTSEALLRPVARVALLCTNDLAPMVFEAFRAASECHEFAVRMRHGETLATEQLAALMGLVARDASSNDEGTVVLVATRVALSRISVVINVIGLMLQHRGTFSFFMEEAMDDLRLLGLVTGFARSFVTDDLTDVLLCMSLDGARGTASAATDSTTLHVGVLRSMLYFCSMVVASGFSEQDAFVATALQVSLFVLSKHSLTAPVLVADCTDLLMRFVDDETCSHTFLKSQLLYDLMDSNRNGAIQLTSPGVLPQLSPVLCKRRKRLVAALARVAEVRYRMGVDREKVLMAGLLDNTAALLSCGAPVELAAPVFFSDIRGLARGVQSQGFLSLILQWVLDLKSDIVTLLTAMPQLALDAVKTWAKLALRCREHLTEDLTSSVPTAFCSFVFDSIDYLMKVRGDDCALSVDEQNAIAVLIDAVLHGHWCNVAVMVFYGDQNIPSVLLAVVRRFIYVEPSEVMSLKKRDAFFTAISAAFGVREATVVLRGAPDFTEVVFRLGRLLTACLRMTATVPLLSAIGMLYDRNSAALADADGVLACFRELCVMLCTNTCPSESVSTVCGVLERMHGRYGHDCEVALEVLLDQSAAYHRVRLRCLLMMLRNPPTNLAQSFGAIFTSRSAAAAEQLISAW